MLEPVLELEQMDSNVEFYHQADERAFFEWLQRIPCVKSVEGKGDRGLVVQLTHPPEDDDLRQLLALGQRFGFDMRRLAKFETDDNRNWFHDPQMYWHKSVFEGN
jgi:hypothetical protein